MTTSAGSLLLPLDDDGDSTGIMLSLMMGFALVALGLGWWGSLLFWGRRSELLAPMAPTTTLWETIQKLASPDSVWFLLRLAQNMSQDEPLIFRIPFVGRPCCIVGDVAVARRILTDVHADKPFEIYGNYDKIVGGKNLFSSPSNAFWKLHRKALAPAFAAHHRQRLQQVCARQLDDWCREFLQPLLATATSQNKVDDNNNKSKSSSFDPDHAVCALTLQVVAAAAFEYAMSREEADEFLHNFDTAAREFTVKQVFQPWRNYCRLVLPEVQEAHESAQRLQAVARRILQEHRSKQKNKKATKGHDDKEEPETAIRLLENHPDYSEQDKIAEIGAGLIGGFESTGTFLANTLYHLAQHPQVVQALRDDLESVDYTASQSKYLQYVVYESYRMSPVAALGPLRVAPCDYSYETTTTPTKTTTATTINPTSRIIPQGAMVILPHIVPMHSARIFDNPQTFDPARWAKATADMQQAIACMFSLGHRNCLGQSLAVAQIHSVLPELVRRYDWTLVRAGTPDYFLTLKFRGALVQPVAIVVDSPPTKPSPQITIPTTTTVSPTASPTISPTVSPTASTASTASKNKKRSKKESKATAKKKK